MIKKIIITALFIFLSWLGGLFYYLYHINSYNPGITKTTNAIVVMVGGENRLRIAIELLKKNYAPIMFITGINSQAQLKNFLSEYKVSKEQIIYGIGANNTETSVTKIVEFINSYHIKSIRLIAANYDMPLLLPQIKAKISDETVIIPHAVYSLRLNYLLLFKQYHKYLIQIFFK